MSFLLFVKITGSINSATLAELPFRLEENPEELATSTRATTITRNLPNNIYMMNNLNVPSTSTVLKDP